MDAPKKIVFLSGTRADFGKIKSLIRAVEAPPELFDVHIFATGMHMEPKYGFTITEIEKCGFPNIYRFINQTSDGRMDRSLAHTILGFGDYVRLVGPDLIVVHGDRVEALAGAMVGALHNVLVAHVEGGEISGTVDELIRHSVSKLSHLHFVSNEGAQRRLLQLGERPEAVRVIGSPDIDIMTSPDLPRLSEVKAHYEIPFDEYAILAFHPVTTRLDSLLRETQELVQAVVESGRNFVAVFPNSDLGSDVILAEYEARLRPCPRVRLFPSLRFENMLVLLRHASFVLGNSSMGIHEAPFYGIPTIDVGLRQAGRTDNPHILRTPVERDAILAAIARTDALRGTLPRITEFGDGQSHRRFREALESEELWSTSVQKQFLDLPFGLTGRRAAA